MAQKDAEPGAVFAALVHFPEQTVPVFYLHIPFLEVKFERIHKARIGKIRNQNIFCHHKNSP